MLNDNTNRSTRFTHNIVEHLLFQKGRKLQRRIGRAGKPAFLVRVNILSRVLRHPDS